MATTVASSKGEMKRAAATPQRRLPATWLPPTPSQTLALRQASTTLLQTLDPTLYSRMEPSMPSTPSQRRRAVRHPCGAAVSCASICSSIRGIAGVAALPAPQGRPARGACVCAPWERACVGREATRVVSRRTARRSTAGCADGRVLRASRASGGCACVPWVRHFAGGHASTRTRRRRTAARAGTPAQKASGAWPEPARARWGRHAAVPRRAQPASTPGATRTTAVLAATRALGGRPAPWGRARAHLGRRCVAVGARPAASTPRPTPPTAGPAATRARWASSAMPAVAP